MSRIKNFYENFRDRLAGRVEDHERERHFARLGQAVGSLCVAGAVAANIIGDYNPQQVALGSIGALWTTLETVFIDGIDAQITDGQQGQIGI